MAESKALQEAKRDIAVTFGQLSLLGKIVTIGIPALSAMAIALAGIATGWVIGTSRDVGRLEGATQHISQNMTATRQDVASFRQDIAGVQKSISDLSARTARLEIIIDQHSKTLERLERSIIRQEKTRTISFEWQLTQKDYDQKSSGKTLLVFQRTLAKLLTKEQAPFARVVVRPKLDGIAGDAPGLTWQASAAIVRDGEALRISIITPEAAKIEASIKQGMRLQVDVALTMPEK